MMTKTILLAVFAIAAGCGGASSKPSATAPPPEPAAPSEPVAAAEPPASGEPAAPATPSTPSEPAAPATPSEPAAPATPSAPATPATPATPAPRPTPPPAAKPGNDKAKLVAVELAAYEKAKPVFDRWCSKCHVKGASRATKKKLDHFDMTSYPFGGHHAGDISEEIREVLGMTGKRATMPSDKRGAVQGAELALIAAWADAFDAAHKAGAHADRGGHEH